MTTLPPPQPLSPRKKVTLAALVCVAGLSAVAIRANAFQLITPEEAALPAGPVPGLQLAAVQRGGRMSPSYGHRRQPARCGRP